MHSKQIAHICGQNTIVLHTFHLITSELLHFNGVCIFGALHFRAMYMISWLLWSSHVCFVLFFSFFCSFFLYLFVFVFFFVCIHNVSSTHRLETCLLFVDCSEQSRLLYVAQIVRCIIMHARLLYYVCAEFCICLIAASWSLPLSPFRFALLLSFALRIFSLFLSPSLLLFFSESTMDICTATAKINSII